MTPPPILGLTRNEPEVGSVIELHTLGDAVIKVGTKEVRPTSPMVFAALLYLCVERGRRVPRAALQELLFPDANERSGAHSLRQLLYKLRQLGVPLQADAISVSIASDVVRDDSDSRVTTNGNGGVESTYKQFLLGFSPSFSHSFATWLDHHRASVDASTRRRLLAALERSRTALQWPTVELLAGRILECDPLNEEATLALAESSALSGSKTRAIDILSRYERETGGTDLRLSASVLRRRISEHSSVPSNVREATFVGREVESGILMTHLRRSPESKSSIVLISGDAGIGKTRLLEEAASLARLEGTNVQVVRCQPGHSVRPFGVFAQIVPALLSCRGALGVSPELLTYLKGLTSHVDERLVRPTDALDDATRSGMLIRAIRDLIEAVAAESPLVLAIEDVHWSNQESLRELSQIVHTSSAVVQLVLTSRSAEDHQAYGPIDSTTVIRLKPMHDDAMLTIARQLIADSAPDTSQLATWCVETAAGNPFFLQMLCAHYVATRQPFSIPHDLLDTTTRRIEQLTLECRRILEFCALLGTHSTTESLCQLAGLTRSQLAIVVSRLESEGHLRLKGESFAIAHDLLRECLIERLPPLTSRMLHGCVAEHLEARYNATADAQLLWDCAEHWMLSGEGDKARQFLVHCSRHAGELGRSHQALQILDRAKSLAKSPQDLCALLIETLYPLRATSQWSALLNVCQQVHELRRGLNPNARHSDDELFAMEASWFMRLEVGSSLPRLLECAASDDATDHHRLEAACLALKIATELCDASLGTRAYDVVQPLLAKHASEYVSKALHIIYNATFGDRDLALELGRKVHRSIYELGIADQFRAASNVGALFFWMGAFEESLRVSDTFYRRALELNISPLAQDFADRACCCCVIWEDMPSAQLWHDRAEAVLPTTERLSSFHTANAIELALANKNAELALHHVGRLKDGPGDSLRFRAYARGIEVRARQLDPAFDCEDVLLSELLKLHRMTEEGFSEDGLAEAIGEALIRKGRFHEAHELLLSYLVKRRERSPIPQGLRHIMSRVEVHA